MAEKMIWRRRPAQLYRCLRHLFQFRKICSEFRSRRCRDFHHHASSNPYRAKQQNFFSVQPIHPLSAAWSRLQSTAHQPAPFPSTQRSAPLNIILIPAGRSLKSFREGTQLSPSHPNCASYHPSISSHYFIDTLLVLLAIAIPPCYPVSSICVKIPVGSSVSYHNHFSVGKPGCHLWYLDNSRCQTAFIVNIFGLLAPLQHRLLRALYCSIF